MNLLVGTTAMTLDEFRATRPHRERHVTMDNHTNRPVQLDEDFSGYSVDIVGRAVVSTPGLIRLHLNYDQLDQVEFNAAVQNLTLYSAPNQVEFGRIEQLLRNSAVTVVIENDGNRFAIAMEQGAEITREWFAEHFNM